MNDRKVALVTAAAGVGIGKAVCMRLARDGYDVVLTDAHERRCNETAAAMEREFDRPFFARPLDVRDPEAVGTVFDDVIAKFGRLDVLVNNAGWSKIEPIVEMDLDTWRRCIEIDLNGTFYCLQRAMQHMSGAGRGGSIVNLASIAAWEMTAEHGAAYSAAKAGILGLTRVAAAEGGEHGIRVNAVAPGLIYNEFLRKVYPDEFFDSYASARSRVGRIGKPEDVASLIGFLVSDDAGYITGETYGISGGVAPQA